MLPPSFVWTLGVFVLFGLITGTTSFGTTESEGSLADAGFSEQTDNAFVEPGGQVRSFGHVSALSVPLSASQPTGALSGRIIFMNGGHGWTWHNANNFWYTQRGISNEMVEDYGNLDQMSLFAAYCFNAGATVVPLRPVGHQTNEVVVDNDSPSVRFTGSWSDSASTIFYGAAGDLPYRFASLASSETATAIYTPTFPASGFYPVYAWARHGTDRTFQLYKVRHTGGETQVRLPHHMVGNGWVYLGSYYFSAGSNSVAGAVVISNLRPEPAVGSVVIADALRFGNGMGDVIPEPGAPVSSYPREEEAARYWIQRSLGQGQPASIYDGSGTDEDDNVGAPIRLAREMNREAAGSMFQRAYVSFHSNAGGGRGTLALYNNESLFPGTATPNQSRYAQILGAEVNNALSALTSPPFETTWQNRGANVTFARSDFAFGEIRGDTLADEMDATIIEVGFHDNASDAMLMRDPAVRKRAAKAACEGLIKYFREFNNGPAGALPEPPSHVRARSTSQGILVEWGTTIQSGSAWVVYRSTNGYGFGSPLRVTNASSVTISNLPPDQDFYFRVAAVNAAGESWPSEVVGCFRASHPAAGKALFVNAFDRFDRTLSPRQRPDRLAYQPPGFSGTIDRLILRLMNSFDYVIQHGKALTAEGVAFDSCANESILSGQVRLQDYAAVLWACGRESTRDETFSAAEITLVSNYLNSGGQVFTSGSEIGWDLDRATGPSAADRDFLNTRLHADFGADANDDAGTFRFTAAAGGLFEGNPLGDFDNGAFGPYAVAYPDQLSPVNGGRTALRYSGGLAGNAAVQFDGTPAMGKSILFGFPFETITSPALRQQYLADVIRFFGLTPRPQLEIVSLDPAQGRISLGWNSVPGKKYQLQHQPALSAAWADVSSALTATAARLEQTHASLGAQGYYRVRVID